MDQGGWLTIESFMAYTHDGPDVSGRWWISCRLALKK
jgi:hypothetical protein